MNHVSTLELIMAFGPIIAATSALIGVIIARKELRDRNNYAQSEILLKVYDIFEEQSRRENRRKAWEIIYKHEKEVQKSTFNLNSQEWKCLEQYFAEMDMVGKMICMGLVEEEHIFERYVELIIPSWDKCKQYVATRRGSKANLGWKYFGMLNDRAMEWCKKQRARAKNDDFPSIDTLIKLQPYIYEEQTSLRT